MRRLGRQPGAAWTHHLHAQLPAPGPRGGPFWRAAGSARLRRKVHGALQWSPPHRSGHHRLHAGPAASRRHYAYCNSPPPARAILREAVTAKTSEAAGRDSASGRIDAVALDSRWRSRPEVAPADSARGRCRTPGRIALFYGLLLWALMHGNALIHRRHEHLGGPWAAVRAVASIVVRGDLSRLHLLERRTTGD